MIAWARSDLTLAVGTSKGNLVLYSHTQRRRVPIMGKHTRSITCGAWSAAGLLALGARDNQVSCLAAALS